jgi:uncharacterized RDD family membrane protein YckC
MAQWQPLSVAVLALASSAADGGVCTVCGRDVGAENLLAFHSSRVCADCKDSFFRTVREQGYNETPFLANAAGGLRYAGFWIRFLAIFLDGLIINAVMWPLSIGFLALSGINKLANEQAANPAFALLFLGRVGGWTLVQFLLQAVYQGWFLSKRGGTPGKLIVSLRVVRPTGEGLTFWRGVGRYFASMISAFILSIGYIMAAFDDEKRALHDRICDTRVVYKNA